MNKRMTMRDLMLDLETMGNGRMPPSWQLVLWTPCMVNGDSCESWSADSAADALQNFLRD
jgi:hypothetical protein